MSTDVEVAYNETEVKIVPAMDDHLKWLIWNWNSDEVSDETPDDRRWWEFWKVDASRKKSLLVVGRYLLEGLDDFIRIASAKGNPLNYKATIISSASSLYDTVISDAKFPWWMKPFGGSIKELIIKVIASLLIDFIINRYSTGTFS